MACGFVRDWMMFSAEDVPQKKHKADAFPTIYIYIHNVIQIDRSDRY
jgi:hypothetical protein